MKHTLRCHDSGEEYPWYVPQICRELNSIAMYRCDVPAESRGGGHACAERVERIDS